MPYYRQSNRHRPFSQFKRLPQSGAVLGSRIGMLIRLPIFLLLTFVVHAMILLCAWIFYVLEADANERITSFLDAVYWAVTTITTVGYGDIVPITDSGKILAMLTMVFGTLCITLYTAFFAGALIAPELTLVEGKVTAMEDEVKEIERDVKSDEVIQKKLLEYLELLLKNRS